MKLIGQLKENRLSLSCMCSALRPLKAEETASLNIEHGPTTRILH